MSTNHNILLYGSLTTPPEKIPLRAGPLSLVFENGDLRRICFGNQVVIQRIYVAVRGAIWDTIPFTLSDLQLETAIDSFSIRFRANHRQPPVDFSWQGEITGDRAGSVQFTMDGLANSDFLRNRIGFCVLHPIQECAGQLCEVETVSGEIIQGRFPEWISPHQPFKNIRAIRHNLLPGVSAEVRLEGETFEMEDQRNWADASFKTYSTPLSLPAPVEIKAGTRITQSVKLSLRGWVKPAASASNLIKPSAETHTVVQVDPSHPLRLPALGLCASIRTTPLRPSEIARLRALRLDHLRVEAHLFEPDVIERLKLALTEARALDLPVELALYFPKEPAQAESLHHQMQKSLLQVLESSKVQAARLLVFDENAPTTPEHCVEAGRRLSAELGYSIPVGGGSRVYFTELNRFPPRFDQLDVVSYSANTQVHSFDHTSQIENTAGIGETIKSARQLSGGKPLAVGPITLRPRFDPHIPGKQPPTPPGRLPYSVDPRQASLLGAVWLLGCLQALVENQAESATLCETIGWKGIIAGSEGSPLPDLFPHLPEMVFPLYHVLAGMADCKDGQAVATHTTALEPAFALALRKSGILRLLIGNGSDQVRMICLRGVTGKAVVRRLDESTAQSAMQDSETFWQRPDHELVIPQDGAKLSLLPYAVLFIDVSL